MAASAAIKLLFLISAILFTISFTTSQEIDQFIYHGFQGSNLQLDGTAEIQSNGLLRLTNASNQQKGHAFYKIPFKFNTTPSSPSGSLSFSTVFVFAMVAESTNASGHGLAFAISPSMDFSQASAGQYLGLFNSSNNGLSTNHILAIELETSLTSDFQDIDQNHVGIDMNGLNSIDAASATYFSVDKGLNKSLELTSGDPIQVWIDYDQSEMLLNVTLAPVSTPKPNQLLLSTPVDLSQVLLEDVYVGFSAATGLIANAQYILGWSFNKSGRAQDLDVMKLPSLPSQDSDHIRVVEVFIILLIAILALLLTIVGGYYVVRRRRFEEVCEEWEREYGPQRFSYKSLYKATKGFNDKLLLGSGGFGKVYRGVLPISNVEIAVKRVSHDSSQGMKEFVAEIVSMGRLRHRNLVQLLGYCRRRGELLLVYDYMPNGSLDKYLFNNRIPNLSWSQRLRIIRGVASGLLYLHEEWEQVVLHRDIKASNVLLDGEFNARLGDFGLARIHNHDSMPQTTRVVGTVGYLAPELARFGKATTSTDVFAFGAFLLEVACGRRPIKMLGLPEEVILVDWVVDCLKRGSMLEASDPRLAGNYVRDEMELVLKLGLFCSQSVPAERPSMRQVLQYLNGVANLPDFPIENACTGNFSSSESSDYKISFRSTSGNGSAAHSLSSINSILSGGR